MAIIALLIIAFVVFVLAAAAIKIVRPYQQGIVEQLGKYKLTTGPGLKIIIPIIQSMTRVDMREQIVDVPPQEVITKDNVTVTVDAVIYYEPTDAQRLVYNVANFILAVTNHILVLKHNNPAGKARLECAQCLGTNLKLITRS